MSSGKTVLVRVKYHIDMKTIEMVICILIVFLELLSQTSTVLMSDC